LRATVLNRNTALALSVSTQVGGESCMSQI
jgi:hypothetical protein